MRSSWTSCGKRSPTWALRPRAREVSWSEPGGAAEAEVDAAGVEGFERSIMLGDDERGVIGQHDAAGADAEGGGAAGDVADEDAGGGAGDAGDVVVLGEPVAFVTPLLDVAGEVEAVVETIGDAAAFLHGGEVED